MNLIELGEDDHAEIEALLLGRRIVKAEMGMVPIPDPTRYRQTFVEGVLTLDDGTRIYAQGNDGGCSCGAGDYPLAHLTAVDNVITSVRFDDRPDDDATDSGDGGWYRIFVVADASEINIASFEGSDGNGFYGTGYTLFVQRPEKEGTE